MQLSAVLAATVVACLLAAAAAATVRRPRGVRWLRFLLLAVVITVFEHTVIEPLLGSEQMTVALVLSIAGMVGGVAGVSVELRTRRSGIPLVAALTVLIPMVVLLVPSPAAELAGGVMWSVVTVELASTFRRLARRSPGSLLDARLRTLALAMGMLALGVGAASSIPALRLLGGIGLAGGAMVLWLAVAPPPMVALTLSPTRVLGRHLDREIARAGDPDRSLRELLTRLGDLFGAEAVVLTDGGHAIADAGPARDVAMADLAMQAQAEEDRRAAGAGDPWAGSPAASPYTLTRQGDRWVLIAPTGRGALAIVLDDVGLLLGRDDLTRAAAVAERLGLVLDRSEAQRHDRDAVASMRAVDRMRDDFLATLSHELRTPLTSIRGFTEVLRDHDTRLPDDQRRDLQARVVDKAAQLERMIAGLLELTAVRGRSAPERVAAYDLHDLVERAVARARRDLREHTVVVDVPPALIETDGGAVLAILGQLLDNAAKFTPAGTSVVVSGSVVDGDVVLTVADDGPGLGELADERVFEAFVRGGDVLTRATRGVGIGLAIARELAEQLDGELVLVPSSIGTCLELSVARIGRSGRLAPRQSAAEAEAADPELHPAAAVEARAALPSPSGHSTGENDRRVTRPARPVAHPSMGTLNSG